MLWDNWGDERVCNKGPWHAHTRKLPWDLLEVVGMVQQMHCSRRLLQRGLEFHVCTINKSAHTKKKVWKLIVCSLCVCVCIYIYIYFFFGVGPKREKIFYFKWIGPQKDLHFFLRFIYFVLTYCFQLVAFLREHLWHKAMWMGYSMRLKLTCVWMVFSFVWVYIVVTVPSSKYVYFSP